MVSLANNESFNGSGSRGAFFFDDSALGVERDDAPASSSDGFRPSGVGSINDARSDGDDDDLLIPDPTYRSPGEDAEAEDRFRPLPTPFFIVLQLLTFFGLVLAVFLVPNFWSTSSGSSTLDANALDADLVTVDAYPVTLDADPVMLGSPPSDSLVPFFVSLYVHGGFWFLTVVFDRGLWWQHRKAQSRGYLEFYRSTRSLRQVPLAVVSFSTALLLLLSTVLQQYPLHSPSTHRRMVDDVVYFSGNPLRLDENNVLQIVFSLESSVAVFALFALLVRTMRFNADRHPPDVQQEDALMQSTAPGLSGHSARDVGFRDASVLFDGAFGSEVPAGTLDVEELLEKQADMIRYLKSHNGNLSRKILRLTAELNDRPLRDPR